MAAPEGTGVPGPGGQWGHRHPQEGTGRGTPERAARGRGQGWGVRDGASNSTLRPACSGGVSSPPPSPAPPRQQPQQHGGPQGDTREPWGHWPRWHAEGGRLPAQQRGSGCGGGGRHGLGGPSRGAPSFRAPRGCARGIARPPIPPPPHPPPRVLLSNAAGGGSPRPAPAPATAPRGARGRIGPPVAPPSSGGYMQTPGRDTEWRGGTG